MRWVIIEVCNSDPLDGDIATDYLLVAGNVTRGITDIDGYGNMTRRRRIGIFVNFFFSFLARIGFVLFFLDEKLNGNWD